MSYPKITELLTRPIIRSDKMYEYYNKMTDAEISAFEQQMQMNAMKECINDGTTPKFPEVNARYLSKIIDHDILYRCLKLEDAK